MVKNILLKNSYYDSATLMQIGSKIAEVVGGSQNAAVMMATDTNKTLMEKSQLLTEEGRGASPNDVVFAIRAKDDEEIQKAYEMGIDLLTKKKGNTKSSKEKIATTVEEAVEIMPEASFAVVSLPGHYAAREVKKLLENHVNVLLFSDNVSLEEENSLKDLAISKDLLMMGPDCGTAIINGVGLGFANELKRGNIGVVAASGTGLQEVTTLISNYGGGISQAFGTGGRDVKEAVGGKMMLHCLEMLEEDESTEKVVIISKPPSPSVIEKVKEKVNKMSKPVVVGFLGGSKEHTEGIDAKVAGSLEEAALMALDLQALPSEIDEKALAKDLVKVLHSDQKYVRGLYCGGTLAYEAILILKEHLEKVYSNIPVTAEEKLLENSYSEENTIVDLGEDEFTLGKPHPMIEPALRNERLAQEVEDPQTAVLLLDVELGYGSHENPGEVLALQIEKSRKYLKNQGRDVVFLVSICATKEDFQGYGKQKEILEKAGAVVLDSNAQAVRVAAEIMKELAK